VSAVLFLDEVDRGYLHERHRSEGDGFECALAFPRAVEARGGRAHVALLVATEAEPSVDFLARVRRKGRGAGDSRRVFVLSRVSKVGPPVRLRELRQLLGPQQRSRLSEPGGYLPAATGDAMLQRLTDLRPDLQAVIDFVRGADPVERTEAQHAILAQQRDAVGSLFRFAGYDPAILKDAKRPDSGQEHYLPPRPARAIIEDRMLEYDASRFLGWSPQEEDALGVQRFSDGRGKTLEVWTVNRERIETDTGVDLIYYHVQRKSLVIVQYKRMAPERSGWGYRPDERLTRQLETMALLDQACREDSEEYRLIAAPCFVKICKATEYVHDAGDLVAGMYFPRVQLERLLGAQSILGPGGGKRLTFENVPQYMTNTLFTQLVASGYIGSAGTSSDIVRDRVNGSLSAGASVVLGTLDDSELDRPAWRMSPEVVPPRVRTG